MREQLLLTRVFAL